MNLYIVPGETKLEAISKVKEKITKTLKESILYNGGVWVWGQNQHSPLQASTEYCSEISKLREAPNPDSPANFLGLSGLSFPRNFPLSP